MCRWPLRAPAPSFLWPVIDPILVTFWENVIFAIPTKSLSIYFFFFLPQKSENVRPHSSNSTENATPFSQSSRENATPSSSTSPLASYKGVPPPPGLYQANTIISIDKTNYIKLVNFQCKTVQTKANSRTISFRIY